MTTRFGVFGETPGIGQGDPYVDAGKPDPRNHGLGLKVAASKQGKNNDACFDKFKPLFEGDKAKLQAAKAGAAARGAERPFRAASPMKASACTGDFVGTLGGRVEYMAASACPGDFVGTLGGRVEYMAGTVDVKKKKGEVQGQPKNIVTACPKKGGFGFAGTTLSERQGAKGVAGEYEYLAEPLPQAVRAKASDKAAVVPFRLIGPPKSGGPGTVTRHFGGGAKGAVGEFEWRPRPEPPAAAAAARTGGGGDGDAGAAAAAAAAAAPAAPFRPAAVPKKGRQATFERFPEYVHDPEERPAEAIARRAKGAARAAGGGAWRPGGGVKSDATRSIVRMNL
ncbi:MAG: hypothetical protein J3K34DRAFT_479964 [Monoraphidium minutum]|nr:MAG: hypothetical protein J3K34DRAFT_479964 [Monoraphidium minutum]